MQVSVLNKLIFNVQILGHRFVEHVIRHQSAFKSYHQITDMSHWRDIMNSIQKFLMQAHVHVLNSLSIRKKN